MPTLGAILEIDDSFEKRIQAADAAIWRLGETSRQVATRVQNAFAYTMVDGVNAFINAVKSAKHELAGLGVRGKVGVDPAAVTTLSAAITPLIAEIGKLNTAFGKLSTSGDGTKIVFADASKAITSFKKTLGSLGISIDDANKKMQQLITMRTPPASIAQVDAIKAAQDRVNQSLQQQIVVQQRVLTAQTNALSQEKNNITALEAEVRRYQKLLAEATASGHGRSAFADGYRKSIADLTKQLSDARTSVQNLTDGISRSQSTIANLHNQMSQPLTRNILTEFNSQLRHMSKSEIETVIQQIQRMQSEMRKTSTGNLYSEEFKNLKRYLELANKELERTNLLMSGGRKLSKEEYITKLTNTGNNASSIKSLERLLTLQRNLRSAIVQADNFQSASTQRAIVAYQNVSKIVKRYEQSIRGVATAQQEANKISARPIAEIMNAANTASVPLAQLKVDLKSVQAELVKMSTLDKTMFNPTTFQLYSQAAQNLANHIAYLNREQKGLSATLQGNAAMGRLAAEGFDNIKRSILSTDTPVKQLERDLADLREILRTTSPQDAMYKKYAQAVRIAEERVRRLRAVEQAPSTPNRGITAMIADANRAGLTLKQLISLSKEMKAALANMTPNTTDWKRLNDEYQKVKQNISQIRRDMGELQNSAKSNGVSFKQLGGLIATAFSAQAIMGFLNKMKDAHAQMQLQRVAIRALVQEKEKADSIYNSVQQMALQSPFTIQQLVTYTKQIAAYRIETDKLVGTTKMLADVSAGLGVDMQRLILAYGQVKSANYLRATEVRQFTEAGLNIAGELAELYTELEGRGVSVADVMDRITKRMVRFEDVEEIFKRVTSAGGLFYDMQKKQAESVYGQIQRIQDALTLMYDDIGRGHASIISGALTTIREIIANWRAFQAVIMMVIGAFGLFKASQLGAFVIGDAGIKKLIAGFSKLGITIKGINTLVRMVATTLAGLGTAAVVGGILFLIYKFEEWRTKSSKLKEELRQINDEIAQDRTQSINRLRELLDIVDSTVESYSRQQEALEEIQRTYKDIFSSTQLEAQNIRKLSDEWDKTTAAVNNYYANKMRRQQEEKIRTDFEQKLQGNISDIGDTRLPLVFGGKLEYHMVGENIIRSIIEGMIYGMSNGTLRLKTEKAFKKEFIDQLAIYYGAEGAGLGGGLVVKNLHEIFSDFQEMQKQLGKIDTSAIGETSGMTEFNKLLEERIELMNKYNNLINEAYKLTQNGEAIPQKMVDEVNGILESLGLTANATTTSIRQITGSIWTMEQNLVNVKTAGLDVFNKMIQGSNAYTETEKANVADRIKKRKEEFDFSDTQKDVREIKQAVADLNGLPVEIFDFIKVDSKSSKTQVIKDVKSIKSETKKAIDSFKTAYAEYFVLMQSSVFDRNKWKTPEEYASDITGYTTEAVEEMKQAYPYLDQIIKALGGELEGQNGRSGRGEDRWAKMANMLKTINSEYKKLLKHYDEETAKAKILESYRESIAETYKDTIYENVENWLGFSDEIISEIAKTLAVIGETKGGRQAALKIAAEIDAELNITNEEKKLEDLKNNVQKVFDNYELTKEFANLGLNVDLIYMFGGKPTTLEDLKQETIRMYDELYRFKERGDEQGYQNAYKEYKALLDRIADLEQKSAIERLKNYSKYLIQSVGERAQIELKSMRDIEKIRNDETLDIFSKEQAIMQQRKKTQEDLAKFDFDQLKGSDVYISVFKDLENASREQLQFVIDKLREMQSTFKDLSPMQVKSIANEMKKLEDALAGENSKRNIFSNLKKSIDYARQRNALLKKQVELQEHVTANEQMLSAAEVYLVSLMSQRDSIQDKFSDEWQKANDKVKKQQELIKQLQDKIKELQTEQQGVTDKIDNGNSAWDGFKAGLSSVHSAIGSLKEAFDSIFEGLDSMGLVGDGFRDGYESFSEILGGIDTMVSGLESINLTQPFTIITGILKIIGGLFKTIGGFIGIGDKKKERQIKRLQNHVDELSKKYEKLEKAIDNAYKMDDYVLGNRQAKQNLEEQQRSYKAMLKLEQDKKKTDKEKIREYQEQIDEISEQLEDLRNEELKTLGGFGADERYSASEAFASAWMESFDEVGDGISGLEDQWDSYIENLIIKQATMRIIGKRMERLYDAIDQSLSEASEDGEKLSQSEMAQIAAMRKKLLTETNAEMKEFVDTLGYTRKGTAKLSDLQMGISNITEEQAAALESITNSIRFGVFQQLEALNKIATLIQQQYSGGNNSALLEEVRSIRTILNRIDSRFNSIIKTGTGIGSYVKVG